MTWNLNLKDLWLLGNVEFDGIFVLKMDSLLPAEVHSLGNLTFGTNSLFQVEILAPATKVYPHVEATGSVKLNGKESTWHSDSNSGSIGVHILPSFYPKLENKLIFLQSSGSINGYFQNSGLISQGWNFNDCVTCHLEQSEHSVGFQCNICSKYFRHYRPYGDSNGIIGFWNHFSAHQISLGIIAAFVILLAIIGIFQLMKRAHQQFYESRRIQNLELETGEALLITL
jgi:hypothetical protein